MIDLLQGAFEDLLEAIARFNTWWPAHFLAGEAYVIETRRQVDVDRSRRIPISPLQGEALINACKRALRQLELSVDQPAKVVLRLPGWVALREPVVEPLGAVNAARAALSAVADAAALEWHGDITPASRRQALRRALPYISLRQTFRKLQGFDAAPRKIAFTWASRTTASRHLRAAELRASLANIAATRGTPGAAAGPLASLHDDILLQQIWALAPHPRALLYFGSSTRYDAMPHANLPIFFYCDSQSSLPVINPLSDWDPELPVIERPGLRKTRGQSLSSSSRLYWKNQPAEPPTPPKRRGGNIPSTYGSNKSGKPDKQ